MNVLEKGMEITAGIWRRMREFGKRLGHQDEIAIVETQNNNSFTTVAVSITSTSLVCVLVLVGVVLVRLGKANIVVGV